MKKRMTISVDAPLADWLHMTAERATNGNISAYLEALLKETALRESVRQHARFFAARPDALDDLEAEHTAALGDAQ